MAFGRVPDDEPMTYTDFNKYVHDFCLKPENIGETIILSIDDSIIHSFCSHHNTTPQELQICVKRKFQFGWGLALKIDNGIPQFFGLLALQVYTAHLMHKDDEYTASAYNPRLCKYLDISQQALQALYREFQDDLWEGLANWGSKNEIKFLLPQTDIGGWRYVKYPISQALLNQEDLKKLPILFQAVGLRPNESVSFEDFEHLINGSDKILGLTRHYYLVRRKLRELDKEKAVLYQIYEHYSKWDGREHTPQSAENTKKTNYKDEREFSYIVLDDNLMFFDVFNYEDERIRRFAIDEIELPEKVLRCISSEDDCLIIFERDKFYDSWIDARYLAHGQKQLILSKKSARLETAISKLDAKFRKTEFRRFSVFEVSVGTEFKPTGFWTSYFAKSKKPFKLLHGLMLSRNVWMEGSGPTLQLESDSKAWLNGLPINLDMSKRLSCQAFPEGDYRLKISGFAPTSFSIRKAQNNCSIEAPTGWQLDMDQQWRPGQNDFFMSGLFIPIGQKVTEEPVRAWLEALTSKHEKSESDIIVVKAIQRKNHGHLLSKQSNWRH